MPEALVLLSGGQDSTTCLAWAIKEYGKDNVEGLFLQYGQRHVIAEFNAVEKLRVLAGVQVHEQKVFMTDTGSALQDRTRELTSPDDGTLPSSFLPGRNIVFLSYAAQWAAKLGARTIVGGMCQTDYSGYPDCRADFIDSMERAISQGLDVPMKIETPLMWLTKAETVQLMQRLGHLDWLAVTNTCYEGRNCGTCPACVLRAKGFAEAGIVDPLVAAS